MKCKDCRTEFDECLRETDDAVRQQVSVSSLIKKPCLTGSTHKRPEK